MHPRREAFSSGVVDIAPILIGVFPFGLIAGVAAVEAGLKSFQAIAVSPIVFAGAAQLASIDLIGRDATPVVVVLTALVINSRMAMYSAALAPHLRGLGPVRTAMAAYLLTDQSFVVSLTRFSRRHEDLEARFTYYFGASIALWIVWQVATIIGVVVGTGVPAGWDLDFAVPLVFIALVFPAVKDRGTRAAAIVGAIAAASFTGLPLHLGLLAASAVGITAGVVAERGR
ncbi:MAG: AzlC family ABC transporter permease [Actinomycetota bacterium]